MDSLLISNILPNKNPENAIGQIIRKERTSNHYVADYDAAEAFNTFMNGNTVMFRSYSGKLAGNQC